MGIEKHAAVAGFAILLLLSHLGHASAAEVSAVGSQLTITKNCPTAAREGVTFACEVLIQNIGDVMCTITAVTDTYPNSQVIDTNNNPVGLQWFPRTLPAASSGVVTPTLPASPELHPGQIASFVVFLIPPPFAVGATTGTISFTSSNIVEVKYTASTATGEQTKTGGTISTGITYTPKDTQASSSTSQILMFPSQAVTAAGTADQPNYEIFVINQAAAASFTSQVTVTVPGDITLPATVTGCTASTSGSNKVLTCNLNSISTTAGQMYSRITIPVTTSATKEAVIATNPASSPYSISAALAMGSSTTATTYGSPTVTRTATLLATRAALEFAVTSCTTTQVPITETACTFTVKSIGSVTTTLTKLTIVLPTGFTFVRLGSYTCTASGGIVDCPSLNAQPWNIDGSTYRPQLAGARAADPITFVLGMQPTSSANLNSFWRVTADVQPAYGASFSLTSPDFTVSGGSSGGGNNPNTPNTVNVTINTPTQIATNTRFWYIVTVNTNFATTSNVVVTGTIGSPFTGPSFAGSDLFYTKTTFTLWTAGTTTSPANAADATSSGCTITGVTWTCNVGQMTAGNPRYIYAFVLSASAGTGTAQLTASATTGSISATQQFATVQYPAVTCATFWPQWNCTTDGASGWLQDQTNANTPAQLTNGFRVICCRPTCAKRYTSDLQCSDPLQGSSGIAGWIRDPAAARTPITDLTTYPYNESDQKTCCNPSCTARWSSVSCNAQQLGSVLRANASSIMLQDNIAGTDFAACCVTQQKCSDAFPTDLTCDADTDLSGNWRRNTTNSDVIVGIPPTSAQKKQCCRQVYACNEVYKTNAECGANYEINTGAANTIITSTNTTADRLTCCRPLPVRFISACPAPTSVTLGQEFTYTINIKVDHGDFQSASNVVFTDDTTTNLQIIRASVDGTNCTVTAIATGQRVTCNVGTINKNTNPNGRDVIVVAKATDVSSASPNATHTYTLNGTNANADATTNTSMASVTNVCSFPVIYEASRLFASVQSRAGNKVEVKSTVTFTVAGSVLEVGSIPVNPFVIVSQLSPTKHNNPLPQDCVRNASSSDSTDVVICTLSGDFPVGRSRSLTFTTTAPSTVGAISSAVAVRNGADSKTPEATRRLTIQVVDTAFMPGATCKKVRADGTSWIKAGNACPARFIYNETLSGNNKDPDVKNCCTRQTVPTPRLTITAAASPRTIKTNSKSTVTFTVRFPGTGEAVAEGLTLRATFPRAATLDTASVTIDGESTDACTFSGQQMTCSLDTLDQGGSVQVGVDLRATGTTRSIRITGNVGCTKGPDQPDTACNKSASTGITVTA